LFQLLTWTPPYPNGPKNRSHSSAMSFHFHSNKWTMADRPVAKLGSHWAVTRLRNNPQFAIKVIVIKECLYIIINLFIPCRRTKWGLWMKISPCKVGDNFIVLSRDWLAITIYDYDNPSIFNHFQMFRWHDGHSKIIIISLILSVDEIEFVCVNLATHSDGCG
jgi:hypothetical protein